MPGEPRASSEVMERYWASYLDRLVLRKSPEIVKDMMETLMGMAKRQGEEGEPLCSALVRKLKELESP